MDSSSEEATTGVVMEYERIEGKRARLQALWASIPREARESFERSFDIEYTHNSTAIEGNTLTLVQTKAVLEDGLSVGGKTLREIYEVVNHARALSYVRERVAEGVPLCEEVARDVHMILMENILSGGIYRSVEARISGAGFKPPSGNDMLYQIKDFFARLSERHDLNPIELAAWTHAEFVRIHPFVDGNGRTARMLMNYQLMFYDFLPVSIAKEDRLPYFEALEAYAVGGRLASLAEMVATPEEDRLDEYLGIDPSLGRAGT